MAAPDYLQQVIVSGKKVGGRRTSAARRGIFQRPSVTSLVWATLDLMTVVVVHPEELDSLSSLVCRHAGVYHAFLRFVRSDSKS